jgi:hypothetical protein
MFAGVSPENYNQTYSSMSHSSRKLITSDKFKRKCAAFGMDDIKFYQFIRSVRMKDEEKPSLMLNELSASDSYYMLTTALYTKDFNFAMDVAVHTTAVHPNHAYLAPDGTLVLPQTFPFVNQLPGEHFAHNPVEIFPRPHVLLSVQI